MALELESHVALPGSKGKGGFDHADVHSGLDRLYVAHTCNDALDIIDCAEDRYVDSVPDLGAVAGALVSEKRNLVFTSNRGENTVSIFASGGEREAVKVKVGVKPNGLAFDPERGILLAANVGDPEVAGSFTTSIVDVANRERIADVVVPGRTRWTVYDAERDVFFVNIAAPAKIVAIAAGKPHRVARDFDVPATGPHGLDLDSEKGRLFCACDAAVLVTIDAASGRVLNDLALSGPPDVIFLNAALRRLYVSIGDPGVIDVIDTDAMRRIESVATERGAHTIALDRKRNRVFAFLPRTDRAAVFRDR